MNETRNAAAPGELVCDVVLKGGVTSGVIYPRLLARLAETYRFDSIGGSSAGAMAAAAAAVAQLARDKGATRDPFATIDDLPATLAQPHPEGGTQLFRLFQPQPVARGTFRVVAALLGSERGNWQWKIAKALLASYWPAAVVGAIPGAWVARAAVVALGVDAALTPYGSEFLHWVALVFGAVSGVVLAALALLLWAVHRAIRALAANDLGLCTGMPASGQRDDALTPWLHRSYNGLLGRDTDADPVTFGELWAGADGTGTADDRAIDLQIITTALNLQRPYRIPNDPGTDDPMRGFYYDRVEWERFFPDPVLRWLDLHASGSTDAHRLQPGPDGRPLRALPEPEHWPLVVAVRMSLSFPGLLSALPLYMVDWTLEANRAARTQAGARFVVSKVYFSDGGIASNFPIHLFDAPLPRHPTFGVNLESLDDPPAEAERVARREETGDDLVIQRCRPFATSPCARVRDFVVAIFGTMHAWRDTMQQTMPGYRDRIVHIAQGPGEGGLNLQMDADRIAELACLGRQAGDRLVADFSGAPGGEPNAWERHRWLRMRSTLDATARYLDRLAAAAADGAPAYRALPEEEPPVYAFDGRDTARSASELVGDLERLMQRQPQTAEALAADAPRPAPALRAGPAW
jgi:predicted acylesterase/phospholipase RssA